MADTMIVPVDDDAMACRACMEDHPGERLQPLLVRESAYWFCNNCGRAYDVTGTEVHRLLIVTEDTLLQLLNYVAAVENAASLTGDTTALQTEAWTLLHELAQRHSY